VIPYIEELETAWWVHVFTGSYQATDVTLSSCLHRRQLLF